MACCSTDVKYGYEDCRFEKDVDEHFHCSVCFNVPKDARMCKNNEHIFCVACISQHLNENSHTCPECNEHLTIDTLRRPRVLNNYLSKLKINCDYASRGCPKFVCVGDLESHVAKCGFTPVLCSNQNCGLVINKQEKAHHETVACEYRKCHDCGKIHEDMNVLKKSLLDLDGQVETVRDEAKKNKDEITQEVAREVREMKESLSKVKADVGEFKVMMTQMLEKLNGLELVNKLPPQTVELLNTPIEDILIAGGEGDPKSAEIFSAWDKNGWFELSPMNKQHCGASSFIYNDQLFVLGGENTNIIETLDLNRLPLKWMKFRGEIPYICDSQIIVHQQRVIHIGGYNDDEQSDVISELDLTSPCTMTQLCQMPETRAGHSAQVLEDKILIMGGEDKEGNALDSVLEYDPEKNECYEMPPLPYRMTRMATVCWGDQVIVLGGCDEDLEALNVVFMYHCKTGKTTPLPSMHEKRYNSCAVVSGDAIVIMGGENDDEYLGSVECLTIGDSTWKYLPAMKNKRWRAVAEVLPAAKEYKYV